MHDSSLAGRYIKYKSLQKQLEFIDIQEEYIKDEMKVPCFEGACKPPAKVPMLCQILLMFFVTEPQPGVSSGKG